MAPHPNAFLPALSTQLDDFVFPSAEQCYEYPGTRVSRPLEGERERGAREEEHKKQGERGSEGGTDHDLFDLLARAKGRHLRVIKSGHLRQGATF